MKGDNDQHLMQMTNEFQQMVDEFFSVQVRYQAAIHEVQTKLEILDNEFQMKHSRNPIHHMQSRMKSIQSMMEKLRRRNERVSVASAVENLTDIAGIRVVCYYIEDIYTIANLLTGQDDIKILKWRDYIQEPKENGYRSLHIVVEVPVFLAEGKFPCRWRCKFAPLPWILGFAGAFPALQGGGIRATGDFRRAVAGSLGHHRAGRKMQSIRKRVDQLAPANEKNLDENKVGSMQH